jgi:hypothetical protein
MEGWTHRATVLSASQSHHWLAELPFQTYHVARVTSRGSFFPSNSLFLSFFLLTKQQRCARTLTRLQRILLVPCSYHSVLLQADCPSKRGHATIADGLRACAITATLRF